MCWTLPKRTPWSTPWAMKKLPCIVYVVQEFKADFVEELDDVRHDPIEVTLDKKTKKELLVHLSQLSGQDEEKYWEACRASDRCVHGAWFPRRPTTHISTTWTTGRSSQPPGPYITSTTWTTSRSSQPPGPYISSTTWTTSRSSQPQGQPPQTLQGDNDHQGLLRKPPQLPGHEGRSRAKWDHEQGFLTILCVDPLRVP